MRHQDLLFNHRLESWAFADAAARNAPGSYVSSDVGRIGYQNNTGDYWRLLTTTPTWKRLNGAYASYQTPVASIVTTSGTATLSPGVLVGMNAPFTPTVTGKILVTISGTLINAIAGKTPNCQIRFGTGAPPAFGASGSTGTAISGVSALTGSAANNASPFSLSAVVPAAALGTPLWFDLAMWNLTSGGSTSVTSVAVSAVELP
jgi:hypothetical protein